MAVQKNVWGLHMGEHVGSRPVDEGYVAIGWPKVGDLRVLPPNREAFKAALVVAYPDDKAGSIPVSAGILLRFAHDMQPGDIVVYPSKHNRMVNIGRFTARTDYLAGDSDEYPNRRYVDWLGHFPRSEFSQSEYSTALAHLFHEHVATESTTCGHPVRRYCEACYS